MNHDVGGYDDPCHSIKQACLVKFYSIFSCPYNVSLCRWPLGQTHFRPPSKHSALSTAVTTQGQVQSTHDIGPVATTHMTMIMQILTTSYHSVPLWAVTEGRRDNRVNLRNSLFHQSV